MALRKPRNSSRNRQAADQAPAQNPTPQQTPADRNQEGRSEPARLEPEQTSPEPPRSTPPTGEAPRIAAGGQSVAIDADADTDRDAAEPDSFAEADVPHEEVALEAYSLYCARGYQDGDDLGDWLAAEQIVRERRRQG
jgi:hypothetical protein